MINVTDGILFLGRMFLLWSLSTTLVLGAGTESSESRVTNKRVLERGLRHRVWEQTIETGDASTGQRANRISTYTELADGLHYWDGEWKESQDLIEIVGNNAVARHGQRKVIFNANLNTEGAIDMQSRTGNRFRLRPLALRYFDKSSGKAVVLAETKDSIGELLPPNRLLYPDAFASEFGLMADGSLRLRQERLRAERCPLAPSTAA
jgi:hypothetical protein